MTNSFVVLLVALVAVLLWFQCDNIGDKKGLLFFILIQQGFNALQGVLRIFPSERALVVRERSAGSYHVGAYFLAKTSAGATQYDSHYLSFKSQCSLRSTPCSAFFIG